MAEEGTYVNLDDFHMSPISQADVSPCGRPERATASKPSGSVKNYSRWAVVCLGLLCVVLALNIGLGIKYALGKGQLQTERNHLLESHVNVTMERDQALASNTNLTRQMDQLQARISKLEKRCPSGWRYFNTKCYLISSSKETWSESRQQCKDIGGDLVIINSKEEQVFIHGLRYSFWIGLMYNKGWKWVDNTSLSTSYWDQGQPDGNVENCVLIAARGDTVSNWHDYLCSNKYYFICGIPAYV